MTASSIQQQLCDFIIDELKSDIMQRLKNSECMNKQYERLLEDICNNKFDISAIMECNQCSTCKYKRFNNDVTFLKCDICKRKWCATRDCKICRDVHDCASENIAYHEEMGEVLCIECYEKYLQSRIRVC